MKKLFIIFLAAISCKEIQAQSVGIGTNAPNASAQLDITSTTKGMLIPRMTTAQRTAIAAPANGLMVYDTNLASFYFYNGTAWAAVNSGGGGVSSWIASGNNIFNNNAGNVGVGTNTPSTSALLDVNSTTKGLLLPRMTTIQRNSILSPVAGLMIYDTDRKSLHHYDGSIWRMILNNDYWNRVTERSNYVYSNLMDSIGIGLFFAPTARLDVAGNIRSRRNLFIDSNVTVKGRIDADGVVEAKGLSSTGLLYVNSTSLLQGNVTGNAAATFNGLLTSNTGVTINDAAGMLTYKTGAADKGFLQLSGDDLRIGTFSSNSAGKFHIRTGGNNNLTVTGDGNVGIGTLNPSAKLHVAGRAFIRGNGEVLSIDGTSNPNIAFYNSGIYKSFISQSSTELFIGVNNARLHLDASQIAIGGVIDAASAYKLTVTGKVICEELKVQLQGAWPDYVFENKYNLMPMSELRDFITNNNHLPNIPAAASMEKNGIEVGEMQRKMMEKIEELTLYVLQLEEKVNNLSKK
jgi:hypothetical protein